MGFARIHCSKEFLAELLKGMGQSVRSNAPRDLEVVEIRESKHHPWTATFVVKSSEYPTLVNELEPPPLVTINYEIEE